MKNVTAIKYLYYTGLLGIIAGISLSKPAVSVGLIICGIAWLIEPNLKSRINQSISHPFFLISLAFIIMHLFGMLWSTNMAYGWKDIKTKLPLVILPLIFIGSTIIDLKKEWKFIRFVLIYSLLACTILSFGIYFRLIKPSQFNADDMRTMLFGVSGVRLALFICFALCILVYDVLTSERYSHKIINLVLIGWFIFFLNFIESGTAMVIMIVLLVSSILFSAFYFFKGIRRWVIVGFFAIATVSLIYIVNGVYRSATKINTQISVPAYSAHGELYYHDPIFMFPESGHIIGKNIAYVELEIAWNKRSKINFQGVDKKNQPIFATILRYLNSIGPTKDRVAIERLTNTDISNIENGIANKSYLTMSGWKKRIHQLVFELEAYKAGMNPISNSLTQRFYCWQMGWQFWKNNFWMGIGTGDVRDAFNESYEKLPYPVDEKFRLRAHNQYLTMALTFGVFGLILFGIYSLSICWVKGKQTNPYLAVMFLVIMLISFLSEDTLETQSGVTFIAFFHLYFSLKDNSNPTEANLN